MAVRYHNNPNHAFKSAGFGEHAYREWGKKAEDNLCKIFNNDEDLFDLGNPPVSLEDPRATGKICWRRATEDQDTMEGYDFAFYIYDSKLEKLVEIKVDLKIFPRNSELNEERNITPVGETDINKKGVPILYLNSYEIERANMGSRNDKEKIYEELNHFFTKCLELPLENGLVNTEAYSIH